MLNKPSNPVITDDSIHKALVNLYLIIKCKIKKKSPQNDSEESFSTTQDNIFSLNSLLLINYIKESIDTLIQTSIAEKVEEYIIKNQNEPQEYESLLIKYEKDIRGHIKIEHQLKLYADNLQYDYDQLKREKEALLSKFSKSKKNFNTTMNISTYEKDLKNLKKENDYLRQKYTISSENEKKLNGEILKLNKEIIELNEKLVKIKKKLSTYEDKAKHTKKNSTTCLDKKVLNTNTISHQFIKRNKLINGSSLISNSMHNNSNNYLDSSLRSLSKKNQEILKKIEVKNKLTSSSSSRNKNLNSRYTHRSLGNFNAENNLNFNKIKLLKEFLIKKEPQIINPTKDVNNPIVNNTNINKKISINKSRMSSNTISLNNSNNNSMVIHHISSRKDKKGNINRISSSFIINQRNNSYVNNINIFTTSAKVKDN